MTKESAYETVIGLEVHVELLTKSKLFCSCLTSFGERENANTCPVCMGLPGAYPVINQKAVAQAVRCAYLLHCKVSPILSFDRKNYLYPDQPRGYQISQFYSPLGKDGFLSYYIKEKEQVCTITQMHLEDDAGKLQYKKMEGKNVLSVNYNRAGIPLVEIVTAPCFSCAQEAVAFVEMLQRALRRAKISDCKMEEGSLRVDVNLSVRKVGETTLRTRCEIKNLSSFHSIRRAIALERVRQLTLYEAGKTLSQQTIRYDEDRDQLFPMRQKENANDYRYFPDPDLLPVRLPSHWLAQQKESLSESPIETIHRYLSKGLRFYDADILCADEAKVAFLDACLQYGCDIQMAANYLLTFVRQLEKEQGCSLSNSFLRPEQMSFILTHLQKKMLLSSVARELLSLCFFKELDLPRFVEENQLLIKVNDKESEEEMQTLCQTILAQHPEEVKAYRKGKVRLLQFFVGQAMKETKGRMDAEKMAQQFVVFLGQEEKDDVFC